MFFFSDHIDFIHVIDDYVEYSKKSITLYKYIENYLDYYEQVTKDDKENELIAKGMESRLNHYYKDSLFYYLDILYYCYTLDASPPYMYADHTFMRFCDTWNDIYSKRRLMRAEKALIPTQKRFLLNSNLKQ